MTDKFRSYFHNQKDRKLIWLGTLIVIFVGIFLLRFFAVQNIIKLGVRELSIAATCSSYFIAVANHLKNPIPVKILWAIALLIAVISFWFAAH